MKSKILKILVFMLTVALMCASFAFVASAETEEVTTPTTGTHQFTIVAADGTETPFEGTLPGAIDARASKTDVVRLEADATFGDDDRLTNVHDYIIDLNGKTISFANTNNHFFILKGSFTLKNGTVDASACVGNLIYANAGGYTGTVLFEDLTVTDAQGLTEIRCALDIVLNRCTFTSTSADSIFYQRTYDKSYSYTVTDCTFNSATTSTGQCVFKFTNFNTSGEKVVVDLDLTNVTVNAPSCDFIIGNDNSPNALAHYDVTMENVTVAEGATAFARYARFDGLSTATVTSIGDNSPAYGRINTAATKHYFPYNTTLKTIIGDANEHGYTVVLCKDYTEAAAVGSIAAAEDIFTLDLGGHTWTVATGSSHAFSPTGNGTHITFANGTIACNGANNLVFANCTSGQVDITFKGITLTNWTSGQFLGLRTKTCTVTIEDSVMNYNVSKGSFVAHRNYGTLTYAIKNSTVDLTGSAEFTSCTDYASSDAVVNFDIEKSVIEGSGVELINSKASATGGAYTVNFNIEVNTPVEDIDAYTFNANFITNSNSATVNYKGAILERTSSAGNISYVHASQIRAAIKDYVGVKLLGNYNYSNTSASSTPHADGCVIDLNGFTLSLSTGGKHFLNGASGRTVTVKNGTIIQKSGNIFFVNGVYDYTLNLEDLNLVTSSAAFDLRAKSMALNVTNLNVEGEDTVFSFRGLYTYYNEETGKFQVSAEDTTELVPLISVNWVGGVVNQPKMVSAIASSSNGNTAIIGIADYSTNNLIWDINVSDVDFNLGSGKLINLREDYSAGTTAGTGVNTTNISLENCTVKCGYFLAKMKDSFETTVSLTNVTALSSKSFVYGDVNFENADVKFLVGSVGDTYVEGFVPGEESEIAEWLVNEDGSFSFTKFIAVSSNLTLYSDFDYNIIVYVKSGYVLNKVTINGVEYTFVKTTDPSVNRTGFDEYLVRYENIAPASANDSFTVVYNVTLADGETTKDIAQTHSIAKYAEKLLAGVASNAEYAAAEQLVVDMLAYIKAAYTYVGFDCADIDAALGENVASIFDAANNAETTLAGTGITSAALELGTVPAIRFYLENAESVVTITYTDVFGKVQTVTPEVQFADDERAYVTLEMRVYNLTKVLTVNVDGNEGTFDVYDYATSEALSAEDKALIEALVAYAETAETYRTPVQEETPEEEA